MLSYFQQTVCYTLYVNTGVIYLTITAQWSGGRDEVILEWGNEIGS